MARHQPRPRGYVLASLLQRAYPGALDYSVAHAVVTLQATARAYRRFSELECNVPLDAATVRRWERRLARHQMAAFAALRDLRLCAGPGALHFVTQWGGDPRGPCGQFALYAPGEDIPTEGSGLWHDVFD